MKIKNGKVKLEPGDVRVGNFVYSRIGDRIMLSDIGGIFTMGLDKDATFAGQMLFEIYGMAKDGDKGSLHYLATYAAVMMNVCSVVPVEKKEFSWFGKLNAICEEGYEFMKGLYDLKDDISEGEDRKILNEVKEMEKVKDEL